MYSKYLLSIIWFLLLTACNNKPEEPVALELSPVEKNDSLFVIDLDTVKEAKVLKMSSHFSKAEYVALETTDTSLLGRISQLVVKGDTLFILDAVITKQVQAFLKNGKHIGTLGSHGNGPDEYINPTSIGLDGSDIYVYDVSKKEIQFYDNQTLKFKDRVKIASAIRNRYVSIVDGQVYSDAYNYEGVSPFLIQTLDRENGQVKDKWLSTGDYALNYQDPTYFTGDVCFYKMGNGIRYYNMFGDTIMNLTKNSVRPYCVVKSKNYVKQEELDNLIELKGKSVRNFRDDIKGLYNIRSYTEWDRGMMFFLDQANFIKIILLDKQTRHFDVACQLYDDFTFKDKRKSLFPTPISGDGDGVYAYIQPSDMDRLFNLIQENHVTDEFKNCIESKELKADSNPVLIYYK